MWIGVISLFPEMFHAIINYGIIGKAVKNGLLNVQFWNPREFTHDRYRTVDDRCYGGGQGMLMMVQPLRDAINQAKKKAGKKNTKVIYLSPQGRKLDQNGINELVIIPKIILVCGRYKGIDERLINSEIDELWSIGDYVISGGELAAMVVIDSIARFIPGVLKNNISILNDSFTNGLLECPHYTRPKILFGMRVPSVLLSGNHALIKRWRLKQSLGRTWLKRPDLLKKISLNEKQISLLSEFQQEYYLTLKN